MRISTGVIAAVCLSLAVAGVARAQSSAEKRAKAKFFAGNKKLRTGNYVGAVADYKAAYADFPNPRILLNLGTAQKMLGRRVAAAKTYEKYLADPKRDRKRVRQVKKLLAELDAKLGRLEIQIHEPGARVLLDGQQIGRSPQQIARRVEPGPHMIAAEKDGFTPSLATVTVGAGDVRRVQLRLVKKGPGPKAHEHATKKPTRVATVGDDDGAGKLSLHKSATPPSRGGHLGGMVRVDVDGNEIGRGAVVTVMASYSLGDRVELAAGGIIGSHPGIYAGGNLYLTTGRFRPLIAVGAPIQFADSTVIGIHAATGLRLDISPRLGILAIAGVERFVSAPDNFDKTVFVPSIGVQLTL